MSLPEGQFQIFSRVSCLANSGPGETIDIISTGSENLPSGLRARYDVIDPNIPLDGVGPDELNKIYSITIVGENGTELDSIYFDESGIVMRYTGFFQPQMIDDEAVHSFFTTWFSHV